MKGGEIKALRQRAGIDRQELADLLRIDPRTVVSWEEQNRRPIYLNRLKLGYLSECIGAGLRYKEIAARWRLGCYLPPPLKSTSA